MKSLSTACVLQGDKTMEFKIKGDWFHMVLVQSAVEKELELYRSERDKGNPLATDERVNFLESAIAQMSEQSDKFHNVE